MKMTMMKSMMFVWLGWMLLGCGGGSGTPLVQETNTSISGDGDEEHNRTQAVLLSLQLSVSDNSLQKREETEVKVMGLYSNGTSLDMTDQVVWVSEPNATIMIRQKNLTALKNTPTRLKARVGEKLSNAVELDITLEIDGHAMPYEPIPEQNDATLLGIDSNHNGIRDDIEIKIYETYADKPSIYIEIANQSIDAYNALIAHPENAKALRDKVNAPYLCASYYRNYAKYFDEALLVTDRIDLDIKAWFFNTQQRRDAYRAYDALLSGEVYTLPKIGEMRSYCDFNTSQYGGK